MNAIAGFRAGLTHFKYSDINFITLGALVEALSGQTLDAYAQEHIFGPLGDDRYSLFACLQRMDSPPPLLRHMTTREVLRRTLITTIFFAAPCTIQRLAGWEGLRGMRGFSPLLATLHCSRRHFWTGLQAGASDFPLQQATLKLMTQPEQPSPPAVAGATIFTADGKTTTGVATRGFGWDINSGVAASG